MPSINKHFVREARIMIGLLAVPIILGIIVAFVVPFLLHQIDIDKCLDSGGKFEYGKKQCIGKRQGE
jgi:hypothetical protein